MDSKEINISKKNNKGLIVVIVILVLIILGMGLYIAYDKGIIFSSTDKETKEAKRTKKVDKNKDTEKDNEVKDLDITKCINNSNSTYSNATDKEEEVGLSMTINSDKRSVTLNIDWSKFGPLSTASSYSSSVESYQIKGFTKDVQSVFVGEVGQDAMGITLFYIMEDKTVERTPIFIQKTDSQNNTYYEMNYTYDYAVDNSIEEQYFITNGVINGVSDVIKLYTASKSDGITTIGAKADGSFYDLGIAIK